MTGIGFLHTTQIAVTVGSFKTLKVKERQNYKILEFKMEYLCYDWKCIC